MQNTSQMFVCHGSTAKEQQKMMKSIAKAKIDANKAKKMIEEAPAKKGRARRTTKKK